MANAHNTPEGWLPTRPKSSEETAEGPFYKERN